MFTTLRSRTSAALYAFLPSAVIAAVFMFGTGLMAQTINIGPNQYAFQFTSNPNYGLFFNSTAQEYQFRNGIADAIFAFDANNGNMTTNLEFAAGSDFYVAPGRYAFRSSVSPNVGLFASSSRIQFRNSSSSPIFSINASDGRFDTDLKFMSGSSIRVEPGAFALRSAAASSAGLFFGASDYEFRNTAGNNVFGINSSDGNVTATGNYTTSGVVSAAGGSSNQWNQAHSWGNHAAQGYITSETDPKIGAIISGRVPMWNGSQLVTSEVRIDGGGKVGINGDASPSSELKITRNAIGGRGLDVDVTVSANSDVRGVYSRSVTSDGFGIGVEGRGGWRGIYGWAEGGAYTGTSFGVYGIATGTAGTRTGVYGTASGGTTNWAGFFASGNVYVSNDLRIGSIAGASGYKVSVNGRIMCTELRVQAVSNWPDYVFADSYNLMPLDELESFIQTQKHLPNIPSAAEVEAQDGIHIGEMQRLTVEKLEELTLYILELKRENEVLKARIDAIEN